MLSNLLDTVFGKVALGAATLASYTANNTAQVCGQESTLRNDVNLSEKSFSSRLDTTSIDIADRLPESLNAFATNNFVVVAPDPTLARLIAEKAEKVRRDLAMTWLGRELSTWSSPCPIEVELSSSAGGMTRFSFNSSSDDNKATPGSWNCKMYGTPEVILNSVIPHEVLHMVLATHFGRPLPRWADEGMASFTEQTSETERIQRLLLEHLTTDKGIPFNQMVAMMDYPADMLPLYTQGYSVTRYLIEEKGEHAFVVFLADVLDERSYHPETNSSLTYPPELWNKALKDHYDYEGLSDLQVKWLAWVKQGSPKR